MGIRVQVKEAAGAVLIFGFASQVSALHLCDQLKKQGFRTTIGMLPTVPGYQVTAYGFDLNEVKGVLAELGVDVEGDEVT